MSDKKQVEKVVFNNDIFETKKEEIDMDSRKKIIYVNYPILRSCGQIAFTIGLFLSGGALGYKYGLEVQPNSLGYTCFSIAMLSIAMLGMIMVYYSEHIYYKKVD